MILRRLFLSLAWLTFSSSLLPAQAPKAQPKLVRSFLEEHCFACHDSNVKKSDLDLSAVRFDLDSEKGMALWVRIHDRVGKGEMPPGKRTARVPESDKASFLESLSKELTTAHLARKGRVLRRLNRVEYENTLQDLLGIRAELKQILPEDGQAHGLTMSA